MNDIDYIQTIQSLTWSMSAMAVGIARVRGPTCFVFSFRKVRGIYPVE